MAVLVLAERRKFRGVFSQRRKLWAALEELEPAEPLKDVFVIRTGAGRIKSPHGLRFSPCTYLALCAALRADDKVAIHDACTFEPVFGVWETAPNEVVHDIHPDDR